MMHRLDLISFTVLLTALVEAASGAVRRVNRTILILQVFAGHYFAPRLTSLAITSSVLYRNAAKPRPSFNTLLCLGAAQHDTTSTPLYAQSTDNVRAR
jgi:hypothetical protein